MASKRKNVGAKKGRGKTRKVEYDDEDISSEPESEPEDAEVDADEDSEAGTKSADAAEDVYNMPELCPPEV